MMIAQKLNPEAAILKAFHLKLKMREGGPVPAKEYDKIKRLSGRGGYHRSDDFLNLEGGSLPDLTVLDRFKNLEKLSLHRYRLKDISALSRQKKLLYLDLRHNEVSDLGPLSGLSGLIYLYLKGNRIQDPTPLATLSELRYLTLEDNPLEKDRLEALRKALPKCILLA